MTFYVCMFYRSSLYCVMVPPVLFDMNMDDILYVYALQEQSLMCNGAPCAGRYEHG